MQINNAHFTYCSNIHAGESWLEVFEALKKNIPIVKQSVCPDKSFGIGLRLSNQAAAEILMDNQIAFFKQWLVENDCYVFTMNGFPYGGFHNTIVKDEVYKPDWTTNERLQYTANLITIMEQLMAENSEAGISTAPLSYKPWLIDNCNTIDVYEASTINLLKCVVALHRIKEATGKYIHIDIEPEPDCLLENTKETLDFFNSYLIPFGVKHLTVTLNVSPEVARKIITDHITVCYDVCHFAVEYENHADALKAFADNGIKIGKVQISAALKVVLDDNSAIIQPESDFVRHYRTLEELHSSKSKRAATLKQYQSFAESTYLHQTIAKDKLDKLHHYSDLPQALKHFNEEQFVEWRTHYHVPVFMKTYNELQSTQGDIIELLELYKQHQFTNHIEVETYTWEVLPTVSRLPIDQSIVRELQWVIDQLKN